jgi:acyl carrier protein
LDARIAVVVDPGFPERGAWDARLAASPALDADALTIRWLRAAESRGSGVVLLRAAPDDAPALRAAVERARAEFGGLHGVVQAVRLGAAAHPAPLAQVRSGDAGAALGRVARDLAALRHATAGIPLDFCVLQNSILPVFGAPGLGVFTAACTLVDACAQQVAVEDGARWTSVGWDRWHLDDGDGAGARTAFTEKAILPAEGVRAFERLACLAGEPRVVVSTHDLDARVAQIRSHRPAVSAEGGAAAPLHPRPELPRDYHAPTNPAEEILAGVWRELMGIEEIGIHDDFFLLGGHSLMGMQVVSRVREAFQVELPLRAVFEAPTIAELAALVDEAILLELDEMSDEEAMRILGAGVA